tara:strand:+ start:885 stop:1025 length:141 start_codon:yes stop_codon:yes gene_type:complete
MIELKTVYPFIKTYLNSKLVLVGSLTSLRLSEAFSDLYTLEIATGK